MPTKKCFICAKVKQIDEISLCCDACEERELDLLISVYAYIHVYGSDFCPAKEVLTNVDAVHGVKITTSFIRSWVNKQWLEKNEVESLTVPGPIEEAIEEDGFNISGSMRTVLHNQKNRKPKYDPNMLKDFKERVEDSEERTQRTGMAFMDKKRGS